MKGIILAGGRGSRLFPVTFAVTKHLQAVYDKPLIYYPLSVLMMAGITDIVLICNECDLSSFQRLLGDGSHVGINLSYTIQREPRGIAECFLLAKSFIGNTSCALILGDNLFYGRDLSIIVQKSTRLTEGALIFGYPVRDPERYGVLKMEGDRCVDIIEKPAHPPSNLAVPGLYFYDNQVVAMAEDLTPSERGELEITAINNRYLAQQQLSVEMLGRGMVWLDTGTPDALMAAASYVQAVQSRQGLLIGSIEEVAYHMKLIDQSQLARLAQSMSDTEYGRCLQIITSSV